MRFIAFLLFGVVSLPLPPLHAEYLKPSPEKAFPEYKIYDSTGRPWRVAKENWDNAKNRVTTEPEWAEWLKKQRAEVDRWKSKPRDRAEWAAGWSHDGVSPKDASRLVWTEAVPGEDVQYFHSKSDPQVPITPKTFAWWVVSTRGRNTEMMVAAARLYRLTGDETYAKWAESQMDFYTDNYLKWTPVRDGARLFWQSLTEGSHLINFTETVRLLGDHVDRARLERWRTQFFLPEVAVLNGSYQNVHNIACWQRSAAAHVALLFGDESMWKEAIDGPHGIRVQIRDGVTSDYLWHEQSFGYNGFVVKALSSLFTTAGIYGRAEQLDHEMTVAENLLLSTTYYRFPNGQLPNPADSGGPGIAPEPKLIGSFYRIFPTSIGLGAVAESHSWDTLLDAPPSAPVSAAMLPVVTSRNLESTRMAILKQGPWQLFFHYGQLTRSHTESEALNFSAAYMSTDVTHDPGTVGYGSPQHRGYHTRGLGHNVPLVDGEGEDLGAFDERREWIVEQPNKEAPMRGELISYSAVSPTKVSAAQPNYRKNARAQRTLAIEGDKLIDSAVIETTDGASHSLGLALHLEGKVRMPETFLADPDFAKNRPEPFQYWQNPKRATYHDQAEFDVAYGSTLLRVTIVCPGEFTLWHASTPDVAPSRRESLYLEMTGKKQTFTTTFAPSKH